MSPDIGRRERMVAMYLRGTDCAEIAREFHVQHPAVRKLLMRAGVYQGREPRPLPVDFREQAETGMTVRQLRRHYGAGVGVVQRWIREIGGRPRTVRKDAGRPVPEGFAHYAATETVAQLTKRYAAGTKAIARWRRETGAATPARRPRLVSPAPNDLAECARRMNISKLAEHFGCARVTVRKWLMETGASADTSFRRGLPNLGAMGRPKAAPITQNRDTSRAGQAADFLRQFGPVIRCNASGHYDPKGNHWRRRSSNILCADEIIARAVRNGWNPDAWREVRAA